MSSTVSDGTRVVSGMRPTGSLHLGHYHGVLKNWIQLQHEYECLFFVADWHALTTHYERPFDIDNHITDMLIDWLAAGLNPGSCTMFIQSRVRAHAELHLLLSMMTPIGWLERVPTYKDQQENLKNLDLATYGFLGYPLLQSADVLVYQGNLVPVGEDQVYHLELTREIARRFNHLYGRGPDFEEKVDAAIAKMGKKNAKLYRHAVKEYQQSGTVEALEKGQALVSSQANLSLGDRERLLGFLEGSGKMILPEPQVLLSKTSKFPGLDGRKMSKSYDNTIGLREAPESVTQKLKVMPTDPARVRRSDPGEPEKCPVWEFHKVYSTDEEQKWVLDGCRSAGIGCIECKGVVTKNILEEQAPIIEAGLKFEQNPRLVQEIIREGSDKAKDIARDTMSKVRDAMGLTTRDHSL